MNPRQQSNTTTGIGTATDPVNPKPFSQSKRDHWKPIVSAWRDSGLSQSAFCRKNDLNLPGSPTGAQKYWVKPIRGIRH